MDFAYFAQPNTASHGSIDLDATDALPLLHDAAAAVAAAVQGSTAGQHAAGARLGLDGMTLLQYSAGVAGHAAAWQAAGGAATGGWKATACSVEGGSTRLSTATSNDCSAAVFPPQHGPPAYPHPQRGSFHDTAAEQPVAHWQTVNQQLHPHFQQPQPQHHYQQPAWHQLQQHQQPPATSLVAPPQPWLQDHQQQQQAQRFAPLTVQPQPVLRRSVSDTTLELLFQEAEALTGSLVHSEHAGNLFGDCCHAHSPDSPADTRWSGGGAATAAAGGGGSVLPSVIPSGSITLLAGSQVASALVQQQLQAVGSSSFDSSSSAAPAGAEYWPGARRVQAPAAALGAHVDDTGAAAAATGMGWQHLSQSSLIVSSRAASPQAGVMKRSTAASKSPLRQLATPPRQQPAPQQPAAGAGSSPPVADAPLMVGRHSVVGWPAAPPSMIAAAASGGNAGAVGSAGGTPQSDSTGASAVAAAEVAAVAAAPKKAGPKAGRKAPKRRGERRRDDASLVCLAWLCWLDWTLLPGYLCHPGTHRPH